MFVLITFAGSYFVAGMRFCPLREGNHQTGVIFSNVIARHLLPGG